MRVSCDQNVHVQLSLHASQSLHVTPRHNLVAVDEAYLEVAYLDDFGLWQVWVLIEVSSYDVAHTFCGGKILEPFFCLARTHVAWGEYVLHFAGKQ